MLWGPLWLRSEFSIEALSAGNHLASTACLHQPNEAAPEKRLAVKEQSLQVWRTGSRVLERAPRSSAELVEGEQRIVDAVAESTTKIDRHRGGLCVTLIGGRKDVVRGWASATARTLAWRRYQREAAVVVSAVLVVGDTTAMAPHVITMGKAWRGVAGALVVARGRVFTPTWM